MPVEFENSWWAMAVYPKWSPAFCISGDNLTMGFNKSKSPLTNTTRLQAVANNRRAASLAGAIAALALCDYKLILIIIIFIATH